MKKNLEEKTNSFQIKSLSKKFVKNNISRLIEIEKDYSEPWREEEFMEYEKDKWILSRYIKLEKEVAGFLIACKRKNEFYINRLMIQQDYRNNGLGKHLFLSFYEECKKRKQPNQITLRVLEDNKRALSFYQRLGFNMIHFNSESKLYYLSKLLDSRS